MSVSSPVTGLTATTYTISTDTPEADGTLSWDSTTMVVVQSHCGSTVGTGWTYGSPAAALVVNGLLAGEVIGRCALDVAGASDAMIKALRNVGRQGIGGQALSAVDIASWDLKVRLLHEDSVSADDLAGLRAISDAVPVDVTAGEYGYGLTYFRRMCQADASRCGGITEWLRVAAVAASHRLEISAYCAPNLHLHMGAATPNLRHLGWFHDHARIELVAFDGVAEPVDGLLRPDPDAPGHGLTLRASDLGQYCAASLFSALRRS